MREIDEGTTPPNSTNAAASRPRRLNLLISWFDLSLSDLSDGCNRAISRSQLHRILRGQRRPTPFERKAIAAALANCLRERCDSAYMFED